MHSAKAEKDKNAKNLLAVLSSNTKRVHLENVSFASVFYIRYLKPPPRSFILLGCWFWVQ